MKKILTCLIALVAMLPPVTQAQTTVTMEVRVDFTKTPDDGGVGAVVLSGTAPSRELTYIKEALTPTPLMLAPPPTPDLLSTPPLEDRSLWTKRVSWYDASEGYADPAQADAPLAVDDSAPIDWSGSLLWDDRDYAQIEDDSSTVTLYTKHGNVAVDKNGAVVLSSPAITLNDVAQASAHILLSVWSSEKALNDDRANNQKYIARLERRVKMYNTVLEKLRSCTPYCADLYDPDSVRIFKTAGGLLLQESVDDQ